MCVFKKKNGVEGIEFNDGTFISFDDLDFSSLTKEQRHQLEEVHLMNELSIRKRLHEHSNILQRIENRLGKIEDFMNDVAGGDLIISVINQKISNMASMVKNFALILASLSAIGYIIYKITG